MRILLVHNPTAGTAVSVKELVKLLDDAGHKVRTTSADGHWQKRLKKSVDLVVAAGGDGTVRDVALAVAGTDTPFAILPFGTANNVGKSLGLLGDVRPVTEAWVREPSRPFDLAEVVFDGEKPQTFVESFGGGAFAELVMRGKVAESSAALLGRQTDRILHTLVQLLAEARPSRWRLVVDGRTLQGDYLAVEVLNIRFSGPNIPLAPEADPGDGQLDVALIREEDRDALQTYVEDRMRLASGELPPLEVVRGSRIRLDAPTGVRLHLDDELWPTDDPLSKPFGLSIRVRPGAARILAPPGSGTP